METITLTWYGMPLIVEYDYTPEEPQSFKHEGWPELLEIITATAPDGSDMLVQFGTSEIYESIERLLIKTLKGE
jgi:hypothetical protein